MTKHTVSVSCSDCGALSLTSEVVYSDDEHRRTTLRCERCGRVWSDEEQVRHEVRVILCGPGAGGSTLGVKVWGPA